MKVDQQTLESVFLRPQKDQGLSGKGVVPGQAENFAAMLLEGEEKSALPSQTGSLSESSAALWAASLLGRIQAGQAAGDSGRASAISMPDQAAGASSLVSAPTLSDQAESEVGGVLEMLEKYMSALGDPQVTLKEIAPMVGDLDRGALRLDKLAAGLGEGDPLKGLTNETAALAAVEALKFKRGDFV